VVAEPAGSYAFNVSVLNAVITAVAVIAYPPPTAVAIATSPVVIPLIVTLTPVVVVIVTVPAYADVTAILPLILAFVADTVVADTAGAVTVVADTVVADTES